MYPVPGVCLFCLMGLEHPLDLSEWFFGHDESLVLDPQDTADAE